MIQRTKAMSLFPLVNCSESGGRTCLSEGKIIDYSRQVNVNRAYGIVVVLFVLGGVYLYNYYDDALKLIIVDIALPGVLFVVSLILGFGSKKAIDYIPGEWEKRKAWVSFSEYEELVDNYEDAYGALYAHPGDTFTGCCLMMFAFIMGGLTLVFQMIGFQFISPFIDSILVITIL